jgi:hypothetical protein
MRLWVSFVVSVWISRAVNRWVRVEQLCRADERKIDVRVMREWHAESCDDR